MSTIIRTIIICSFFMSPYAYSGAWGTGSFENDSAFDWVYELEQSKSALYLITVFNSVPVKGYIEVDQCSAVIAAADVTASLKDGKTDHLPKSVATWVTINKQSYKAAIAAKAIQAIEFCKNVERSEIAQLWHEGQPEEWLEQIESIEVRLK